MFGLVLAIHDQAIAKTLTNMHLQKIVVFSFQNLGKE